MKFTLFVALLGTYGVVVRARGANPNMRDFGNFGERTEVESDNEEQTCEHQTMEITCDGGIIEIVRASYGRSDWTTCAEGQPCHTIECDADSSMDILQEQCNGRESCSVDASNSVFGDPCFGTFKYLDVGWNCLERLGPPDNVYKKFMLVFLQNYVANRPAELFIAPAGDEPATFTVNAPYVDFTQTSTVQANNILMVQVPAGVKLQEGPITNRGIEIVSDVDIVVYGVNKEDYTTDGFLGLPEDVLGTSYIVASWPGTRSIPAEIGVVAVEDNTEVTIDPTSPVRFDGRYKGAASFTFTLNSRFDAAQVTGYWGDLTGTTVTSDKPVAVLSGHRCGNVPEGVGWCDHLVEMIPAKSTLGRTFVTMPIAGRTGGDIVRIIATEDGTDIDIVGRSSESLNEGRFVDIETSSTEYLSITANNPIMVVQYNKGQAADWVQTDPFMMLISPVEQYDSRYTFATVDSPTNTYTTYIGIVIKTSERDGIRLDGAAISPTWTEIPGSDFSAAAVQISAGTHNTRHTNPIAVFSLYLYGHTPYESFASIGGSRLYPYGDPCTETETSSGDGVDNDCDQRVDEELRNGVDDDGDGLIDEDLASEEGEVDECAENTHECDANADCINTHGSYNCECRPGYTGDGRTCEGAEGVCKCNGDTHCYTFDSRKHDYQGICEYILFETAGSGDLPALSVYISLENRNGRTHVSYVWKVSLLIYGVRIDVLLANKAVLWNGWQFNLGSTLPHGLTVRQSGSRVVIKTSFGLLVVVSGKSGVQLRVPGPYRAGTNGGICGNWNGDANDDNLKPDGSAAANTAEYGDSWVTTAPCGTTTSPVDPLNGCDVPRMEALCNLIRDAVGPFAGGHGALAPGGIFDDCVYDCCATDGSPDEVCEAAGFYVAFVQHLGSAILAWRTAEFCQPSCPTNSHYELCGTACPATCTDTGAPDTCAQHCVEGCVCDEGYVRSGRRCVSVFDCGCVHNGFYYNVGSTWFTENCNERCTCNGKNDLSCEAVSCHADAFCGVQEQIYGCHCNDGFIGDGIECRPPGRCPAGWTEYGLSCFQVVQTQVTCDEAGPSAAAMDARLAIIRDEEMHNFVANLMSAVSTSDTYYIGLSDQVLELAFYWSDGSYLRSYNRWGPGYPGGWDRNNNCVFYYYANGAWWWRVGGGSMYCLVERYFFCPEGWHQWGGSCYYAFSFSYSWDATWTFLNSAEGYYSSLAMINSQEENDYVYNMIGDGYRIGAYRRNGYWYWRWWYRWYRYYWWYYIYWFNWQNGDPNNGGDCAVFSPGGFWEDDDCAGGRPFCAEMDINECNSNPCGPNSRCINHPNGYTCECIPGCMGEGCRASGNCWVVTGSHYFQFDGSRVDFLGSCSYVLARYTGSSGQLTRFTVTSGNEYRDGAPDVPYLSWVSLAVGETTITLRRNGVAELNGRPRNTPFYVGRMMAVRRSGYFVSITTSFGLLVEYDGDRAVHIELSSGYGNAVEGMCGDFSGDSDGDLERPDGTDAGSATVFGDSWRSDGCPGGTPSVYPWDGCDTSGFVSGCSIISDTAGPFGPYLQALFAQTVYEACLLDQCVSSGDDDQRCSNIQTFAAMCSSVGWVAVDWAGPASCPRDCPANSQFVTCAPICQSTCADTEPQQCGRCRGACVCDEGFVLSGDSCVPKSDCGCTDGDGFYYPNNAVFTGTDCFTTGTCTNGELTYVDLSCHDYAYCDTNDEGVYGCHCEAGYIGDGVTSCTLDPGDCPDGFVPYAYSCFRVTPDTMTFDDCAALAAAATENGTGRMALISDQGTHDFVSTLVSSSSASWIGLDDRNVEALFTWSDGSYLGAFNLWGSGAPGDNGDCVSYPAGTSTWQDGDCTATAACIIEIRNPCPSSWVARKGWCYKYFKGGQSYEGARQKCIENYGSAMAAIRSSAENAFVFNKGHGWTSSDGEFSGYVNEEDEDAEGCPYQYRSSGGQQPQTEMACEHSELTLTCSNGYELVIQSANYGRTDGSTCPHSAMSDTNCVEPTSLDIVRDACRDRSTCTISASNSVFGDPCYGTYKYLTVGYFCRRQPGLWKREPCQRWLPYTCRLDVNECASGDNECDVNAVCTNTPGGYTCACKIGYTGDGISPEYGGQGCVRRGLCTVWGNAHVYTFDGAHYTYNGKCYYDMAVFDQRVDGLTRWRVEVRLKSRTNSLSSSVEEVFIYIANNVYKLLRDAPEYSRWPKCMRNRLFQHTPNYFDGNYDSRIRIYRRGGSFQLVTDFGLVVTYNRDHRLQIVIPEPYRNAGVMGLCGNFNGDSTDDQTGRDGTVSADVVTFADSWNSRPTIQYCTDPTPPTNPRDGCNTAPFEALCEVLRDTTGPLAAGHAYVDPQVAYQNCLYDLCAEGSDYVCSVYQAYVEDCAAFGASFGDWRTPTSCPYTCPENSHYSLSTSPCRATCAEPDAPASCGVPNAEGCECDDGYIWSGDVCVRNPADCGCLFDGTYLQLGEYRVIGECEIVCHCSAPNTHTCEVHGCGENGFCRTSAGRTGCECLPGFVDNSERQDGTLCDWNVCERGWKYHGQSCYHIPKARRNNRKAEQHCKALHPRAILARVLDRETHEFLLTMIQQTGKPRLGFRIAGNEEIVPNIYRRSDYAPLVDFQFFVEGQPESAVFFKRCLAYAPASSANSGKVEAVGCNGAAAFICEIPQACPEQYEPLERVEGEPWFCHRINCTDDGDCDETAVDIDECAIGEHDCHPEAFCLNNNGSYTCVCMPGRVGNGTHCQQAGLCQISGDPNFVGLDGQSFSFQGDCKYTMVTYSAGARSFVVEVSFEHREHETSAYVNYVSVTFDGHKVEIFRGRQFIVDGIRRNIPAKPSRNTNLEISFFGNYVIVETRLGLRVIYDGWQLVQVTLPSTDYLGAVGGLCGNFNGDPDDDLEMPDGNQAATVNDFVNSWLTADQDPASCVPPDVDPLDGCDTDAAGNRCALLLDEDGPFANGFDTIDNLPFYEACVRDLCVYSDVPDDTVLCFEFAAYAAILSEAQVVLPPWRSETLCPLMCGENEHYDPQASPCTRTCAEPDPGHCIFPPRPRCVCNEGYLRSGLECVPVDQCGCWDAGFYYKLEEVFYEDNCRRCGCGKRPDGTPVIGCRATTCHPQATCTIKDGRQGCHCNDGLFGDGIDACASEPPRCDPGFHLVDGRCCRIVELGWTYSEAQGECRAINGRLVVVNTEILHTLVVALKNKLSPTSNYWIGYDDIETEGVFVGSDGLVLGSWNKWSGTSPHADGPDCVLYLSDQDHAFPNMWSDRDCESRHGYICERDVDECSNPDWNNCHANARCLNTFGSFECECNTGFIGDGVNQCSGSSTCRVFGSGPHFFSHDRLHTVYRGGCDIIVSRYTGSAFEQFEIVVSNKRGGEGNSRTYRVSSVKVVVYGITIQLFDDRVVWVNGIRVWAGCTPYLHEDIYIYSRATALVIRTSFMRIILDSRNKLDITLSDIYAGVIEGMCGDLDGDPTNDNLTPDGTAAAGDNELAMSWAVETITCSAADDPDPECESDDERTNAMRIAVALNQEEAGSPFQDCFAVVNPAKYFLVAITDLCNHDLELSYFCDVAAAYARACYRRGVQLPVWRVPTDCPLPCMANAHYASCTTACPATCRDRNAPNTCEVQQCVEGCVCDDGFVLGGNKCTLEADCGCTVDGFWYPLGYTWFKPGCTKKCTCTAYNDWTCEDYTCEGHMYECNIVDAVLGCHCKAGFVFNEDTQECEVPPCPDGWITYEGSCYNLFNVLRTWWEARAKCIQWGATLVTIKRPDEAMFINLLWKGWRRKFWVGLYDEDDGEVGNFRWVDGAEIQWRNWYRNEPEFTQTDADGNTQRCGVIMPDNRTSDGLLAWRTDFCVELKPYICERDLDVDECANGVAVCDKNAYCVNTPGSYRCICNNGFTWDETFQICQKYGRCHGNGDPHYHTFDGKTIDFMGVCEYTLSEVIEDSGVTPFIIRAKQGRRDGNTAVSFIDTLIIQVYSDEIIFQRRGGVYVNGPPVTVPVTLSSGVQIFRQGLHLTMSTPFGLQAGYDGKDNAFIVLPAPYMGKVRGICGNFNLNKLDDCTKADGTVATSHSELGDSFLVGQSDSCVTDVDDPRANCDMPLMTYLCSALTNTSGAFAPCHDIVDPQPFFDNCVYDLCAYDGDTKWLCNTAKAYADVCLDAGVAICDWRSHSFCRKKCTENAHYTGCGGGCPATCSDPSAPETCGIVAEGCVCDEGYYFSDNICVPLEQCGCTDSSGYHQVGTRWVVGACSQGCSCDTPNSPPTCVDWDGCADVGGVCRLQADGIPGCQCIPPYTGDGVTCNPPPCDEYWTLYNDNCYRYNTHRYDYDQAKQICSDWGGLLCMPKSQADQDFLMDLVRDTVDQTAYIGVTDIDTENVWMYEDGTQVGAFTYWTPDPEKYNTDRKDCTTLRKAHNYHWFSDKCYQTAAPCCQKPRN